MWCRRALCRADAGIAWICSPGSPCASVYPRFPRTPEYFFRFRFDTLHSAEGYCLHTTTFTLRLHGLPMDFQTSISLVLGTLGVCVVLLLLVFAVRECRADASQ